MEGLEEALKDLRDIHDPAPISFWPPAPGWWLLPVLFVLLFFLIRWWRKKAKLPKFKKMAFDELKNITTNYEVQRNGFKTANECALLIRKYFLATDKHSQVAGLIDDKWLEYLDKKSGTNLFTQGAGKIISTVVYQKETEIDAEGLLEATRILLKNV